MRHRAKVDDNHGEIVRALRAMGCSVLSLASIGAGCPDLLVGIDKTHTLLLEVKDGAKSASRRKLTPDETEFFATWRGRVAIVESVDEALQTVQGYGR